ncbi:MAG: glutamate--tRNA ligase [Phycisphaerae bacterium]|nr:glutamate--tRNA ligase [Phycisphaerae bacterium]
MSREVITRFAPSPTGYLHVGGARTALFNWLFARHCGGVFLLRIEDTDMKRNTPTAARQVMDDLRWLGLEWDEGPEVGGPNGPYLQSERLDIYGKYTKKLVEEGKAYYCFDTPEELDAMRQKAIVQKSNVTYARPQVFPEESDVKKARAEGRQITVRFAMPDESITVKDVVRGEVTFAAADLGDFIIQKSDGFPTYHFACVVDDELMEVTHVIRGQEHLMNTPGHQALQRALGFKIPQYAHMSVTVSEGGGKLSKRQRAKSLIEAIAAAGDIDKEKLAQAGGIGVSEMEDFLGGKSSPDGPAITAMADALGIKLPEINVVDFLASGYVPEAMVNFLARLGWSPNDSREVMTINELIESFDITRLNKTNSLFDRAKLVAFNTEHIKMLDADTLAGHLRKYMEVVGSPVAKADEVTLKKLIEANHGARTLEDIDRKSRFLFVEDDQIEFDEKAIKKVLLKNDGEGIAMLKELKPMLTSMPQVTEEELEKLLRGLAEQKGVGLGKVAQPLRVAMCGTTVSPPIFVSIEMLGMDRTIKRIDNTVKNFSES